MYNIYSESFELSQRREEWDDLDLNSRILALESEIERLWVLIDQTPTMTVEEAQETPYPESNPPAFSFRVNIGGYLVHVRLVRDRSGNISFHQDYRISMQNIINLRNRLCEELGLLLVEQRGIIL